MPIALRRGLAGALLLAIPLVAVALLGSAFASTAEMRIVVNFMITLVLVAGIQSFSGNSGIVSFGHVSFMAVGAYAGALLVIPPPLKAQLLPDLPSLLADASLGFLPAVLAGSLVAALVAAVLALALSRMQEGAMAMATFGLLVVFFVLIDNANGVTRGASGLYGIPTRTTVWTALACALVALVAVRTFKESAAGLQLRASRSDAVAAEALGTSVVRVRYLAWVLSGAVMGMGGALWAQYNLAFGPEQFYVGLTFNLLAMIVVGGFTTVSGAVVGAATITVAFEAMRRVEESVGVPGITQIVVALMILLVLYRRPEGLVGDVELDERLRRVVARRRGERARA